MVNARGKMLECDSLVKKMPFESNCLQKKSLLGRVALRKNLAALVDAIGDR